MIPHITTSDDRAVSTAISHVLTLGITAVLISGLVVGTSGFVQTERDQTTQREMTVVGERMADELEQLDGLVANSGDTARLRTSHPRRIAGSAYTVTLTPDASDCGGAGSAPCLILRADSTDARTVVTVRVSDPPASVTGESTAKGGELAFAYDSAEGLHVEPRGDA